MRTILDELRALAEAGWRFSRDGSTATASFFWDDPDECEDGWEVQVLKSEGHLARYTLEPSGSGLTERSVDDLERLLRVQLDAQKLMLYWQGQLPDDDG